MRVFLLELNYGSFSKKIESVGLSCQKLVFLFLALKLAQKRPKIVARILRPNFFGFDTYKLHVKHSRLLLTKKGPRNDTRSPTIGSLYLRYWGVRIDLETGAAGTPF